MVLVTMRCLRGLRLRRGTGLRLWRGREGVEGAVGGDELDGRDGGGEVAAFAAGSVGAVAQAPMTET